MSTDPTAVPTLLRDPEAKVRKRTVDTLCKLGALDRELTLAVEQKAGSLDSMVPESGIDVLGQLVSAFACALGGRSGDSALDVLYQNLRHGDKQVRLNTVKLLGYSVHRGPEAVGPILLGALYDKDPEVRRRAASYSILRGLQTPSTRCG